MKDQNAEPDLDAETPEYTADWFQSIRPLWDMLLPHMEARRVLEVGSYEGASACLLIDVLGRKAPLEIHCIDHWEGGSEHRTAATDMALVERRFRRNTAIAVRKSPFPVDLRMHKGGSDRCLGALLGQKNRPQFDFVYIDGSHQAADVLLDASMAFRLLRKGGVMVLDDYLWRKAPSGSADMLALPKMGIDAFINCHYDRLRIVPAMLDQIFLQKMAD